VRISKTAEYSFNGSKISLDELASIMEDARLMMADHIEIRQTSYNEPPYGTSTNTVIEIVQGKTMVSGEGY
jgi:hypothetical protein